MRPRLGLMLLMLTASCGLSDGYAIHLTVRADDSVPDAVVAKFREFEFQFAGASSAKAHATATSGHRVERVVIRLTEPSDHLDVDLTVFDLEHSTALARGMTTVRLTPGATSNGLITLKQASAFGPSDGADMATDPGKTSDMATDATGASDMTTGDDLRTSPVDLSVPPDMTNCAVVDPTAPVWVDPVNGTDDEQHGGGPGICALKSFFSASSHAKGRINLVFTGVWPVSNDIFYLRDGISIDCDPNKTGKRGILSGTFHDYNHTVADGTVSFAGSANGVFNCEITGLPSSADGSGCIVVAQPGKGSGHIISNSYLHNCAPTNAIGIWFGATDPGIVKVSGDRIENVSSGMLGGGGNVVLQNSSFANDLSALVNCGATAGCGNTFSGSCSNCASCQSSLIAACP